MKQNTTRLNCSNQYFLQVDDEDDDDDDPNKTYDLIILGLPWKTSEDDIREYFEVVNEYFSQGQKINLNTFVSPSARFTWYS